MKSFFVKNYIQLIGHCGGDTKYNEFANGQTRARVSLATSYNSKDADGNWVQHTTWHRVVGWGPKASTMRDKLGKGSRVMIEGRLEYGSYEKEGVTVKTTDIVAERVLPL